MTQVAISIVLVIGAGLMVRSLANAQRVNPGVDADRIAVIGTDLAQGGVTQAESAAVVAQLLERVAALPGIERAAVTSRLPARRPLNDASHRRLPAVGRNGRGRAASSVREPRLLRDDGDSSGRAHVRREDRADTPPVIVVNQAAARAFWGGNAIGGRMQRQAAGSQWVSVVGVIADAKVMDLTEDPTPAIYLSTEQAEQAAFRSSRARRAIPRSHEGARDALHDVDRRCR